MAIEIKGLELRGAYGRETDMNDWKAGKDFKIIGGPYCSKRDISAMSVEFQMLEFMSSTGKLVERIFLSDELAKFAENNPGHFTRV